MVIFSEVVIWLSYLLSKEITNYLTLPMMYVVGKMRPKTNQLYQENTD